VIYTDLEKKLASLVLNQSATRGEVENAGRMFFASLRKRGVGVEAFMDGHHCACNFENEYKHLLKEFVEYRDWMGEQNVALHDAQHRIRKLEAMIELAKLDGVRF
jgi:hypothetical protein